MESLTPELKKLLKAAGCRFMSVDAKIKSRHTANAVLRQAGLPNHF